MLDKLLSLLGHSRNDCIKSGYDQVKIVNYKNTGMYYCKQGIHAMQRIDCGKYQCVDCGYTDFEQIIIHLPNEE